MVPVLGRPDRAQPLVDSLRATSDAPLVFVASANDRDQIIACNATGETVLIANWKPLAGDYARKMNLGYRKTEEEWIFCGADDLRFTKHWDEHALQIGGRSGAGVVGTQDLGNPFVKRGLQSTHPLVRRTYIEEWGGAFDDTGDIYSETYSHQFVDIELCEAAKTRRQWAFAKRSVVEHMHPAWNKGVLDPTYEKAMKDYAADRKLFQRRARQFGRLARRRKATL